jgi:glycerol-3-phosphate acyltransferase PlsY
MAVEIVLVALVAYLLGGLQFARLVSLARGVDLMQTGSGVASVANVRRSLGLGWALLAATADVAKALVPVWLANAIGGPEWAAFVGVCVMIGHNWPIYTGFNGGRGMLTGLATAAVLLPRELAILALVLVPMAIRAHDTAPFALAAMLLFPVVAAGMGEPQPIVLAFVAIAYIVVLRRLTAPPHGRLSLKTLLSKLVFDRPDPNRHWTLEVDEPERS